MKFAKSRWATLLTFVVLSLSVSLAQGQSKMTSEQKADFESGNAVSLSNYDVVKDRTSNFSMQRIEKDAVLAASFSYGGTTKAYPSSVIVSMATIHQEFRWDEVETVLFRYGGHLHEFPIAETPDGKRGYNVETNQNGQGWFERVSIEVPTADFVSMSEADLVYIRIGDKVDDTFSIEGKSSQAFKNVGREIGLIKPDATVNTLPQNIEDPKEGNRISPLYNEDALNLGLTQLPVGYKGQNPEDVYNSLVKKFTAQQEFETKDDFKNRLNKESLTPVVGNIPVNGYFAATVDLSPYNMRYDADLKSLKLSVHTEVSLYSNPFRDPRSFRIMKDFGVLDTYVGQNNFGVEKQVNQTQTNSFELLFNNSKDFSSKNSEVTMVGDYLNFSIPMLPTVAMSVKPDLRMLVVYQLQSPYVEYYENYAPPKVDNPEEKFLYWYYIRANIRQFWFFNATTGEIYKKFIAQNKR